MNERAYRIFWWTVYAAAFGLTEAVLVVYVRRMLGMAPGLDYAQIWAGRGLTLTSDAFSTEFHREGLLKLETLREAGTIFLLVGAAMAAGRSWRERWGIFLYTFAVWDLSYYLYLALLIGFPRSLLATDVYFLIPITWYGPVWFPVLVVMPAIAAVGIRLFTFQEKQLSTSN